MGRKRTRAGKFVHICLAGLILFSWSGCTPSKRQSTSREVVGPQAETRERALEHLQRAKALLQEGEYKGSLTESQKALALAKGDSPGDEALYLMGMILAHSDSPKRDYEKALACLQRLLKDYPQSPRVQEARVWTAVLQESQKLREGLDKAKELEAAALEENQKLKEAIEKAKEVDIMVEKKKREKEK